MNTTSHISAYERLRRQRCTIEFRYAKNSTCWRINALRGGAVLAYEYCGRTASMNLHDACERAKLDRFGPTSTPYAALQRLAKRVEDMDDQTGQSLSCERKLFSAERELEQLREELRVARELAAKRDAEQRVADVGKKVKAL